MPSPLNHGESCVLLEKKQVGDGMGGRVEKHTETLPFNALVRLDNSMLARQAGQQGVTSVYTVFVDKAFTIKPHAIFKRLADGQKLRVTSNPDESATPAVSGMNFKVFSAEKYIEK